MKDYSVTVWIMGKAVNVLIDAPNVGAATDKVMDMSLLEILGKLKVSDVVLSYSAEEVS